MSYRDTHLFFDLDRTIWDFERNSEIALRSIYNDKSKEFSDRSFYKFIGVYKIENAKLWKDYAKGKVTKDVLRYKRFENTFKELGLHDEELIRFFGDEYVVRSPEQIHLMKGALDALSVFTKMGFSLHIITNGFKEVQHKKLKNCKLEKYFDVVVCSEEVGFNKPNPEIFDFALQKTGAKKSNAIMIGDDYLADIHGAIASGWKAVFYNPLQRKNYGYRYQFDTYEDLLPLVLKLIA